MIPQPRRKRWPPIKNLKEIDQPKPLAKISYDILRASILSGELNQEEIYNEMALAKTLGISRTPVREALLELSTQGLVTFLPRKGIVVNQFSRQDVEEIFELRWVIESYAIQKVAASIAACDLSAADEALRQQYDAAKRQDTLAYLEANTRFHLAFSDLTGNRRFASISRNIRDMIQLMSLQASIESRMEETIAEHEAVLTAVRQGDPRKAQKAIEYHLNQFRAAVLAGFEPDRF